jgi:hypothetical protein
MASGTPDGPCKLCLAEGKLTFEHIPPEAAGNDQKVISAAFEEWFSPTKWTGKGAQQQRGAGDHTLCADCNNRVTGRWYVPEYVKWAQAALGLLQSIPPEAKMAELEINGGFPLRFIKQVVAMLFSVNSIEFAQKNRELAKFVLERDAVGLPEGHEVYLALVRGRMMRGVGLAGVLDTASGNSYGITEVAFPPFGHSMRIGEITPEPLGRITEFATVGYDDRRKVVLRVLVGEVFSPYPGDYRSKAEIEATRPPK